MESTRLGPQSRSRSRRPSPGRWQWASLNPGSSVSPRQSTTWFFADCRRRTSCLLPTRAIRSPATATASAEGFESSMVNTLALTRTRQMSDEAMAQGGRKFRSTLGLGAQRHKGSVVLLVGVVGTSHQRARGDMLEAHAQPRNSELFKLRGGVEPVDGDVLG